MKEPGLSEKETPRPTIHDVASRAGVSIMAVSLAFRDGKKISEKTRRKILSIAKEMNYVPNQIASGLRTGKSHFVGLIVYDITNPFLAMILQESEQLFSRSGMEVLMGCSQWDSSHERRLVEKMIRMRVQGVVLCLCEKGEGSLDLLRNAGIPFLLIDSIPETYKGAAVVNDLDECGRLMARHFVEIGIRRPGFVNADPPRAHALFSIRIFESFREELAKHGLTIDPRNYVEGGLTLQAGANAWRQLVTQSFDAEGLFCINDLSAIGLMDAADKDGRVVGRDLAVAGVDNLDISGIRRVGLTSIHQPYEQIASHSVDILTAMIRDSGSNGRQIFLPQKLVVRESTANFQRQQPDTSRKTEP